MNRPTYGVYTRSSIATSNCRSGFLLVPTYLFSMGDTHAHSPQGDITND